MYIPVGLGCLVQAIGSVLAIVAAIAVAWYQSKRQHESKLELFRAEHRRARAEAAKTLAVLGSNSVKNLRTVAAQISSRVAVSEAAEGLRPCNVAELRRIDDYLKQIPLHDLPDNLVILTMALRSTVRQAADKIEMVLRVHRDMNSTMYKDFFTTIRQMIESLAEAANQIEAIAIVYEHPHETRAN